MAQTALLSRATEDLASDLDIQLQGVSKTYNGEIALHSVDLAIGRGEFFSILGPSGCGKTTTLRLIAGFETPSTGTLQIRGRAMAGVPPYRRPVNTVFQSYALFGHMTVAENVAFGLKMQQCPKVERRDRVREALQLVKMEPFANRRPQQLSGGQQQRVALARALVNRPAVLLLDEPLGALDLKLRKEMQVELSNLHQSLGLTFVMVTHDQEEALSLSTRIAVMNAGRVEQVGTPSEIYDQPATPFVADFIGATNLLSGRVAAIEHRSDGSCMVVRTSNGLTVHVNCLPHGCLAEGQAVMLSIRPEKIHLNPTGSQPASPESTGSNGFLGHLRHVMYLGTHLDCVIEIETGDRLAVRCLHHTLATVSTNAPVSIHWATSDCLALAV